MNSSHDKCASIDQQFFSIGNADEVGSAIDLIFNAFENTSLHEEAVRQAKEYAVQLLSGERKDRTLAVIEELGHMMDLEYWKKKKRSASYFVS